MSGLIAKRLAQQVTELRSSPDNKRCFNCESLGTTYYVPQFSIFVCTSCSGIHMQFGHRVKSVTLADYKADEVEHMREGGNQVAAYRFLAKYTPDKDLRKPVDRNPQRVRIWIQTVFIDKRFFSPDAPVPRRSQDGSGSTTPAALTSPAGSLRRSSSSREGSLAGPLPAATSAPISAAAVAAASRGITLPSSVSSPPVRDLRNLLGDRATALHVGPKLSSEQTSSSAGTSRASSVTGLPPILPPAPAAGTAQPSPRPTPPPAFDPFAAPATPLSTPAMHATPATAVVPPPAAAQAHPAAAFDPFGQQAATPAAVAAASAPAATSNGWDAFVEAPASNPPSSAAAVTPAAGSFDTSAPAATAAAVPGSDWASFGDGAFGNSAYTATPAPRPSAVGVTGGSNTSAPAGGFIAPAVVATKAGPAAGVIAGNTGSAPVTPSGKGKPPAKELAADMFADFAHPQPVAAVAAPYQQAAMVQYPQQQPPLAAAGAGQQAHVMGVQPQQLQYGMMATTYGKAQQPVPLMQQQAMAWQQQQQAAMGMYGGVRPQGYSQQQQQQQFGGMPYGAMMGMNGVVPGAYGATAGFTGAVQPQQQAQQQQPGTPASPSWTVNTTAAGVMEESAFADLVDLKKVLPSASTPAAGPAMVTSPSQQQQPYSMPMMAGMTPPGSYGTPGAFASAQMMQQPMMGQQRPVQQSPYAVQGGMYAPGMPGAPGSAAGQFGMPSSAAPAASQDSGNPFA